MFIYIVWCLSLWVILLFLDLFVQILQCINNQLKKRICKWELHSSEPFQIDTQQRWATFSSYIDVSLSTPHQQKTLIRNDETRHRTVALIFPAYLDIVQTFLQNQHYFSYEVDIFVRDVLAPIYALLNLLLYISTQKKIGLSKQLPLQHRLLQAAF